MPSSAGPPSAETITYRFRAAIRRALSAAGLPDTGARLVVGCSGGPDSTALLLALTSLQGELDLGLHVVYVDHGLRPRSAADGQHVLRLAGELDLPAEVQRIHVAGTGGLMAAARAARYEALLAVARAQQAHAIAVGHTRSDQAETMLMRLLGGAGLRGLSGMRPARPLSEVLLLRPLLSLGRAEVVAFLEASGVVPLQDPTNQDRRYLRGRIRHDYLHLLSRERPDLEQHLHELSEQLRGDADYLEACAAAELRRLRGELGDEDRGAATGDPAEASAGPVLLPAAGLRALALPLATRVVQLAAGGGLSRRQIRQVLDLCASSDGSAALDLSQGRRAERRYGVLRLDPPTPPDGVPSSATPSDALRGEVVDERRAAALGATDSAQRSGAPSIDEPTTSFEVPVAPDGPGDEPTATFLAPELPPEEAARAAIHEDPTTSFAIPDDSSAVHAPTEPTPRRRGRGSPRAQENTDAFRVVDPAPVLLVPGPGEYQLLSTRLSVELSHREPAGAPGKAFAAFAADQIRFPLVLRARRPGDRILLRGLGHHKKVSDVLIDQKVPRPTRAQVLLLCQGEEVLWIVGLRASEYGSPPSPATPMLVVRLTDAPPA